MQGSVQQNASSLVVDPFITILFLQWGVANFVLIKKWQDNVLLEGYL